MKTNHTLVLPPLDPRNKSQQYLYAVHRAPIKRLQRRLERRMLNAQLRADMTVHAREDVRAIAAMSCTKRPAANDASMLAA